jgi:hypothetical protein
VKWVRWWAWIACLGCAEAGDAPPAGKGGAAAGADAPPSRASWLREVAAERGLAFRHETGGTGLHHMPEIMAGGAALLDYDRDGDLDVYLVNGGPDAAAPAQRGALRNSLFRNDGQARFEDVSAAAGAAGSSYGMGAAVGDVDNDGDEDLYVTNLGPDELFVNRGDGRFEDRTAAAGIRVPDWSASAAFFDYDRDGFLDLFVTQYVDFRAHKTCRDNLDKREYCGPKDFPPLPDVLLHNRGGAAFEDVGQRAGIAARRAAGLGVVCLDLDEDGWQDAYVANDSYENHLWVNQGDGSFVDDAVVLGAAFNMQGQAEAGMGVVAADLDGDALTDLFVTHLRLETNTLFRGLGPGAGFVDWTGLSGLGRGSHAFTGFGTAAVDLELDGDLDILVANGRVARGVPDERCSLPEPWCAYAESHMVYRNEGGRFVEDPGLAPEFSEPVTIGRGLAVGDLDGDGDLDVVLNDLQGPARLCLCEAPRRGRWLLVDPLLSGSGRRALGARLVLEAGERRLVRHVVPSAGYLTSSDPRVHFGLGPDVQAEDLRLLVAWPDGAREAFPIERLDALQVVVRGTGEEVP